MRYLVIGKRGAFAWTVAEYRSHRDAERRADRERRERPGVTFEVVVRDE
jgi:hypothetical protein